MMCGYFCIGFIDYMLAGNNLIDILACFCLMILRKMIKSFWTLSKNNKQFTFKMILQ